MKFLSYKKSLISEWLNHIIWACIILYTASDIFSIAIVQIAASILIILFVVKKIITNDFSFNENPLNIPFLLFIIVRIISVVLSTNFQTSLPSLYKEIIFYFVFFVFVNEIDIGRKERIKILIQIIIAAGVIAAIYGISVYLFVRRYRISSTTSGYYTLGMYLTASLSLSLMLGKNKDIFLNRIIWWFENIILITGILLTFDRLHWIIMSIVVFISGVYRERKLLVIYVVIIIAALILYQPIFDRLLLAVKEMDFSERSVIWRGALLLIGKHPIFGFGPNTFREIFPLYNDIFDKGVSSWHNDFIQLYIESGIVGLGVFIYLIIITYKSSLSAFIALKKTENSFLIDFLRALIISFSAFLIGGFLGDSINLLFFLLIYSLIAISLSITKPQV